jgi:hypothetical protein
VVSYVDMAHLRFPSMTLTYPFFYTLAFDENINRILTSQTPPRPIILPTHTEVCWSRFIHFHEVNTNNVYVLLFL